MIKKENIFLQIKLILSSLLIGFFYVMGFYTLFKQIYVLPSILYFFAFFIVFHFFCIEIYRYKERYFIGIVLILGIFMTLRLGDKNFRTILSILALHVCIIMLHDFLRNQLYNTIKFNSLNYFVSGGYIFTVWITLGYGLALVGLYTTFPYTCEGLSHASNKIVDTVTKPFKIGLQEVQNLKENAKLFFGANINDVIQFDKKISLNNKENGAFVWLSKELIKQIQNENIETNMGICDFLLKKIHMEFGKPEFAASVVLLIFLMLYPFVRIVVWIMSIIAFFIFKISYLLKIYKIKILNEEVEKIE